MCMAYFFHWHERMPLRRKCAVGASIPQIPWLLLDYAHANIFWSSVNFINQVTDRIWLETEERMEQGWRQQVAQNVGSQKLFESLSQPAPAVKGDSSAKAEFELLEI